MSLIHPVFITDGIYQSHKCFTFMAVSNLCSCALPITVLWRSTISHGVKNKFLLVVNVFLFCSLPSLVHNYATVTIIHSFIRAKKKCRECCWTHNRRFRLLCRAKIIIRVYFCLRGTRIRCGLSVGVLSCLPYRARSDCHSVVVH